MLKFYHDSHSIKVDPMSLTLDPLLQIYLADTGTNKLEATKMLTYLHLVSQIDQEAPYAKVDPNDVSKLVRKELWGDFNYVIELGPIDETFMENAVLHYQSAYESSEEASVRSYDRKIYEIREIIDTTKIEIKTSTSRGVVTYVSNFTLINKMMQDVIKIVKARDELKALILKQSTRQSIKGNQKLSFADKRRKSLKAAGPKVEDEEKDEL